MNIAVFELESWEKKAFESLQNKENKLESLNEKLSEENAQQYSNVEIISIFVKSQLDAKVLSSLKNLKMIATRSTGYDHIDTNYCRQHNIAVCNVPSYGKNTVAEHSFGLMLLISRKLYEAIDRVRQGEFSTRELQGFDLRDKTLGVIGTGEIGSNVIRIAKGFEMKVIAFDIQENKNLSSELGFSYYSLEEVLKNADIITLHVPANPTTRHLLGAKQFDQMKQGVILINTSRGNIVDVEALLKALLDKKVAAAGLDVLPEEPAIREGAELLRAMQNQPENLKCLLADHALLQMQNVYITPHNAFNTREAVQRILDTTIENIQAYQKGKMQNNVLEKEET